MKAVFISTAKAVCGAALAAFAFCLSFGGCIFCAVIAGALSGALFAITRHICPYLRHFIAAAICAVAAGFTGCGFAFILGTAMPFVPGLAVCNSLQGALRARRGWLKGLVRALLGAAAMAAGYAVVPSFCIAQLPLPNIFYAALGAAGFALMLGANPFLSLLAAFACSAVCLYANIFVAVFAAYMACFLLKRPSLALLSVVPLVPGGALIMAFAALFCGNFAQSACFALLAVHAFFNIALARLCACIIYRLIVIYGYESTVKGEYDGS